MPKNKKPRKRHIPYGANINPLAVLQEASTERMTPDKLRDLAIQARSSFEALCQCAGGPDEIQQLCIASNISLVLCEGGLGTDLVGVVREAQKCISEYAESPYIENAPTAHQRAAITSLLDLQDQQLAHEGCNEGRMVLALREIQYRVTNGHAKTIGRP